MLGCLTAVPWFLRHQHAEQELYHAPRASEYRVQPTEQRLLDEATCSQATVLFSKGYKRLSQNRHAGKKVRKFKVSIVTCQQQRQDGSTRQSAYGGIEYEAAFITIVFV